MPKKRSRPLIFGLIALGLVAACALAVLMLLNTPFGLRLLIEKGLNGRSGFGLSAAEIRGGLLGSLTAEGVRLTSRELTVEAERFSLSWNPKELLAGRLHILAMEAEGIKVLMKKGKEGQEERDEDAGFAGPFEIRLPLSIQLDRLEISKIRFKGAEDAKPVRIDRLVLEAAFHNETLQIGLLEISIPAASLDLSGTIHTSGSCPMELNLKWRTVGLRPNDIKGRGGIRGDLQRLILRQDISGAISGTIEAEADHLLDRPTWSLKARIGSLSEDLLRLIGAVAGAAADAEGSEASASLRPGPTESLLKLDASGDKAGAEALLDISLNRPCTGKETSKLQIKGSVRFSDLQFEASGRWQGLCWPLAGKPRLQSEYGLFEASGRARDYRFGLRASLSREGLPKMEIQGAGNGSEEEMDIERLHAELLGGKMELSGRLSWSPHPAWDLKISAKRLDPSVYFPDWPARLNGQIKAAGSLGPLEQRALVEISRLEGRLRGRPLSARGRITLSGAKGLIENISIEDLSASCGRAFLEVSGRAGTQMDVAWRLKVPDASELAPDADGSLESSGRIFGSMRAPSITARAEGAGLVFRQSALSKIEASVQLFMEDSGKNAPEKGKRAKKSVIDLKAEGIRIAGRQIGSAVLKAAGLPSDHEIELSLSNRQGSARLRIDRAAFLTKSRSFKGLLDRLDVKWKQLGSWRLDHPVMVSASGEGAALPGLCLKETPDKEQEHMRDGASLCMDLSWLKKGPSKVSARLRGLDVERLRTLLPPDITELTGRLEVTLDAAMQEHPTADLEARLTPGIMIYLLDEKRRVRLHHQGGRIHIKLAEGLLTGRVRLSMGDSGIEAEAEISQKALEKDPLSAPISGRIQLGIKELGLISAFFPAVRETQGELTGRFQLAGTLGAPRLIGRALLDARGPEILMAGLTIDRTRIEAEADGSDTLSFKGRIASGSDEMDIAGRIILNGEEGWPVHVSIQGREFTVVNIPDALVRITPDLNVEYSAVQGVRIRGTVQVPEAEIRPRQLPPDVKKPSRDVVIVSAKNPDGEKGGIPVDAEVTVALLDRVRFRGFGLDCFITGRVTITALPDREPLAHGELRIRKGTFRFYGHDLVIKKGIISWAGGRLDNPGISLLAVRSVQGTVVGVRVSGHAMQLDLSGYSTDPSISSQDALTMLMTGKSRHDPGFSEAAVNTATVAGADLLAQQLKGYTGLDYLNVRAGGENASETRVFAGKDINDRLVVGIESGTDEDGTQFVARYHLWKGLELEVKSGPARSGVSLMYTIELK